MGSEDVYGPPELLRAWAGDIGKIVEIRGADHFLEGRLGELEGEISTFLAELATARTR